MTSRKTSRRAMLTGTLATAGGLASFGAWPTLTRLALAGELPAGDPNHRYVFCYFNGGWDNLIGLDPRDPELFTDDNAKETGIDLGYNLLERSNPTNVPIFGGHHLGPYAGELADLADQLCIVRGMSMDTLTHQVGRRRFITGRPPSGLVARGSSVGTWLAALGDGSVIVPHLAISTETYNVDLPNSASALKVNTLQDLSAVLSVSSTWNEQFIQEFFDEYTTCPSAQASPARALGLDSRSRVKEIAGSDLAGTFDFTTKPEVMAHYGLTNGDLNASKAVGKLQAAIAGQAIKSNVSRVVSFQAADGLDTHYENWGDDHGPNLEKGFNAVARLITDLATPDENGKVWLEDTTILAFSEFTRTARINNDGGRDHSLTNSCFLTGRGIKKGAVVGASSDVGLSPQKMDLETGVVSAAGEIVRPDHILQALLYDAGLMDDEADLREDPLLAILETP
jgi:hypothetical protein